MARRASEWNRFAAAEIRDRPSGTSVKDALREAGRKWRNAKGETEIRENPSGHGSLLKWLAIGTLVYIAVTRLKPGVIDTPALPKTRP